MYYFKWWTNTIFLILLWDICCKLLKLRFHRVKNCARHFCLPPLSSARPISTKTAASHKMLGIIACGRKCCSNRRFSFPPKIGAAQKQCVARKFAAEHAFLRVEIFQLFQKLPSTFCIQSATIDALNHFLP